MNTPLDQSARNQALNITESFAVAAPAGSGKTGLLTLRVLKLLAIVKNPEEILCITFTNKAAQEMTERILGALHHAANIKINGLDTPSDPHEKVLVEFALEALENDETQGWNLLNSPTRLRVMTIDGLCRNLTNQLPILSTMGGKTQIFDNAEFAFELAIRNYIEDSLSQPTDSSFYRLLAHLDGNISRLSQLMVSLLANRDQWLDLIYAAKADLAQSKKQLSASVKQWIESILLEFSALTATYECELCSLGNYAAHNLIAEAVDSNITQLKDIEYYPEPSCENITEFWLPLAELLLTKTSTSYRKKLDKRSGFPTASAVMTKEEQTQNLSEKDNAKNKKHLFGEVVTALNETPEVLFLLGQIRNLPSQFYEDQQWQIIEALLEELPRTVAYLRLAFSQLNGTDFIEVATSALSALSDVSDTLEVSDLALKLDYQIHHLLVDEFQDTSYPQLKLLESLTREWLPDEHRTLYAVGDGMQSCYGFRNANVGIFLNLRQNGLKNITLQPLDLTVNFRSKPEIVEWVNDVFEKAYPQQDNINYGAVKYSRSHAFQESDPQHAFVKCHGFISDNTSEEGGEQEALHIADLIKQYQRDYPDETIAVLGKSRSHLQPTIDRLKQQGVAFTAIDIDPISQKQIIVDLVSLTKALSNYSDRIAWLALLRTPWCGIDLKACHALVNNDITDSLDMSLQDAQQEPKHKAWPNIWLQIQNCDAIATLTKEDKTRIKRLCSALTNAIAQRKRKSFFQILETTWLNLGGHNQLITETDIADVKTFFSLVAKHEEAGSIQNFDTFEKALNKLYAQSHSESPNPVQFMTMHKSKGLEFDTVFIPSLTKRPKSDDGQFLYWHELINDSGEKETVLSPISSSTDTTADELTHFIKEEKKQKNKLESLRLLYVACTRAKKRLHLSANFQANEKTRVKPPSTSSLLSQIWQQTESQFEWIECGELVPQARGDSHSAPLASRSASENQLQRLPLNWTLDAGLANTMSDLNPLTDKEERHFDNNNIDIFEEFKVANHTHQAHGILLHRVLRRITLDGIELWDQDKILQTVPYWVLQLNELDVPDLESQQDIIERMETLIHELRNCEQAKWILNNNHQDSQCELKLFHRTHGQYIVDRTFIDQDNQRWIIDYKSSVPDTNESLEHFLQREQASYRDQLLQYSALMKQESSEDITIRMALYFPYIRVLSEL